MTPTDALIVALVASIILNILLLIALHEAREDLACATEVLDLIEEKAPLP